MEMSQKEKLIYKLKKTIKAISEKPDSLDVSCMVVRQEDGEYVVDIFEYL